MLQVGRGVWYYGPPVSVSRGSVKSKSYSDEGSDDDGDDVTAQTRTTQSLLPRERLVHPGVWCVA